jgi:hypothetical protein
MSTERRRSPRVEILGRLHGLVVTLDAPVMIREISLGGMSVETTFEFPAGIRQEFQLTLGDGSVVVVVGLVRHSHNTAALGDTPRYVTGLQFVDDDTGDPDAVSRLMENMG